jgi:hypothetical protein
MERSSAIAAVADHSLVSNSLIDRENTGNLFSFEADSKPAKPKTAICTGAFSKIPWIRNREFNFEEQGNF